MSGLVVIGGSYAGVQAAISAREAGYAEDIVMVSDEETLPYQRPPLSKAYLLDGVSEAGLVIRGEKFFAEQRIELILGKRAVRLDRTGAGVVFDDGRILRCERIVIATGSRARSLPAAQGVAGVHYLRSLADARSLKQAIETCAELVVIGGGFIGLEVAASAKKRGKNVVVVESAERLISRALSPTLSNFLYDAHRRRGVDVRLGLSVDKIVKTDARFEVHCAGGERFACDTVLVGIGGVANMELAAEAGIVCDNGIVVDEFGRTSVPEVLSAGDCAVYFNNVLGKRIRLESVQHAQDQAKSAGAAVAGTLVPYTSVPRFWSDQYDLRLQMNGLPDGNQMAVLRGSLEEEKFSIFLYRDGKLAAVESVNRPADQMITRKLIAGSLSPSAEQAGDLSFDLRTLAP